MFEHSLIDLEAKQPRGRRWISLPIAVALHLVGLTAFAFASYWTVGAVQEPTNLPIVFIFNNDPPLPAPSGGGGGHPKPVDTKPVDTQPKPKPTQPVQPTAETVPDTVPKPTASTPVDDVLSGLTPRNDSGRDDLPVGPGYGKNPVGPGGNGDSDSDRPDIGGGHDEQPIRLTADMVKPEVLLQVQPRYTEVARRAGTQGTVVVEAVIDERGYVTNVRVLRGLPMGLDRAATEAIQQWRFKPATLANRPVKVYFTLTVNFTIQR